jgi:DNA-binding transcriptional regulator YiaG/quercetin dioxygenase-like cupin family protein
MRRTTRGVDGYPSPEGDTAAGLQADPQLVHGASSTETGDSPTMPTVHLDADRTIRSVGGEIRRLRNAQGLKLQDVAARTGVSVSMLSMLERGVAGASIGTLVAVSSALGVHMADLFRSAPEKSSPVRRLAAQMQVETASGVLRRVVHHAPDVGLEMVVNEYIPGASSGLQPVHHSGKEFGLVVQGSLVVELEGVRHELGAGDGISYASSRGHIIKNEGPDVAKALWVNLHHPGSSAGPGR